MHMYKLPSHVFPRFDEEIQKKKPQKYFKNVDFWSSLHKI